jgi:hypothetical protein
MRARDVTADGPQPDADAMSRPRPADDPSPGPTDAVRPSCARDQPEGTLT